MKYDGLVPTYDYSLIWFKAYALECGHIKLATWGTREDLLKFAKEDVDKYREPALHTKYI